MDRISNLFNQKNSNILSVYFCAGAPLADNTAEVITTLSDKGIDMIEIGIPFSDPMADGPVIQEAATTAIRNGMSLRKLLKQLDGIRDKVSIPLILMGYLNPVIQYGLEDFFSCCNRIGIDGVIIPDLPFNEYMENVKPISEKYNIKVIMLITPETSDERIRQIDSQTSGFIYMVSSAAVTGTQKDFNPAKLDYFKRIDAMKLNNNRMIGFGISNKPTFEAAAKYSSGCIVGSLFVNLLKETNGDAGKAADLMLEKLNQ